MLYRDHREYGQSQNIPDLGILRNWLLGRTGNDSLRIWLRTLHN